MLISRPSFKRLTIFDGELVAIELKQTHVKMDKPIAVGMCVLDISKITMYSFLYDYLKPKYGEKCRIAYTDIDSFILDVETKDFYNEMLAKIELSSKVISNVCVIIGLYPNRPCFRIGTVSEPAFLHY